MTELEITPKVTLKDLLYATPDYSQYNLLFEIPTHSDVAKKLYLNLEGIDPKVKMVVDRIILSDSFNIAYDLFGGDIWLDLNNKFKNADKLSKDDFAYSSEIRRTIEDIKRIYRREGTDRVSLRDDLTKDFKIEDASISQFRIGLFDMSGVVPKDVDSKENKVLEYLHKNEVNGTRLLNKTGEPMSQEEVQRLLIERICDRPGVKKDDVEILKRNSRLSLYLLTGRDPNNFRGIPKRIVTGKGLTKLLEDFVPFFEFLISGSSDEKLILYFGESKHLVEPFKRKRAEYKGRTYYKELIL